MSDVNHQSEGEHGLDVAEYVLGTAAPETVEDIERRLVDDADTRAELAYWEHRLGSLALALAPVAPPAAAWQRIADATDGRAGGNDTAGITPRDVPVSARAPAANGGIWRGLAIAASVVAVVLAVALYNATSQPSPARNRPQLAYASVIVDKPTGASWLITADAHSRKMSITAMSNYNVPSGKMLKAWLEPANGKPVPIGRFPNTAGEHTVKVSSAAARLMDHANKIMVSMENVADADDSAPKGRLMWVSPVARRTS